MNIEELKNRLDTNGLGRYYDKLQPVLRNTIRLYQREADEKDIAIGKTKIGGKPDLPEEINWVSETSNIETTERKLLIFKSKKQVKTTRHLSFIAQVNLAEVSRFDKENLLPKTGLLYFFYSAEQEGWGFDHKDKDK